MPRIMVKSSQGEVEKYILKKRVISIGRDEQNDIVIPELSVSRKHARILAEKGGVYTIQDLNSANGTFVNNDRIESAPLQDGDVIKVGNTELSFYLDKRAKKRGAWAPRAREGTIMEALPKKESKDEEMLQPVIDTEPLAEVKPAEGEAKPEAEDKEEVEKIVGYPKEEERRDPFGIIVTIIIILFVIFLVLFFIKK